jgi:hypothetical protein
MRSLLFLVLFKSNSMSLLAQQPVGIFHEFITQAFSPGKGGYAIIFLVARWFSI